MITVRLDSRRIGIVSTFPLHERDEHSSRGDPDTWGLWLAWANAHGINMDNLGIPRGWYGAEQLRRVNNTSNSSNSFSLF